MKEYNALKIEQKWQAYWEENQTFKTDIYDFPNRNSMRWICFLIHPDKDFMSVIPKDIRQRILFAGKNGWKGTMFYIRWGGMRLGCLRNSLRSIQGTIPKNLRRKTLRILLAS